MTNEPTSTHRSAAIALSLIGLLVFLASWVQWDTCPTTPCGGALMAISEYSGVDLGFGVITALAGLALTVVGLAILRGAAPRPMAIVGMILATVVILTIATSIVWMYAIPGDEKDYYGPPTTALFLGILGVMALLINVASGREGREAPGP